VEIEDIKFIVIESLIVEGTGLPWIGEKWFKNRGIETKHWKVFLKKPSMDTTIVKKGLPTMKLKSKWRSLLLIIQKIVT